MIFLPYPAFNGDFIRGSNENSKLTCLCTSGKNTFLVLLQLGSMGFTGGGEGVGRRDS